MGILQKADRCMDEAAALFGENKLFLAEKKAQETAGLYKSCGAYEQMAKTVNLMGVIYASIGDVSMSIDCYLEAMDVAVEQGSTEIIMLVNNNIDCMKRLSDILTKHWSCASHHCMERGIAIIRSFSCFI